MLKRFLLYALRWQLSTPVLALVLMCSEKAGFNVWMATIIGNFIGSCIFFWVDKLIFRPKIKNPLWEVKEDASCSGCGKQGRCYRLFRAKKYDRTDDQRPIFLCEGCSKKKVEELRQRGVEIP